MKNLRHMTELEQEIVKRRGQVMDNLIDENDSDDAKEFAIALFRAASCKLGADKTSAFERWLSH
jgi:hypothetical protein